VAGWNFIHAIGTVAQADRTALRAYLRMPAAATVEAGSWIIWDAVQMFAGTEARPYVDGDQLGCAWTGTAHASTSTSTAGYLRIALADLPLFSASQGTICVAVKHRAAYNRGGSGYLFSDGGNFYAAFAYTTDKWLFTDGTNTEGSGGAAQTFVPGDIDILHFVWGPGRLEIYLNGVLYDGGTAFTPWTLGTYLYIGCSHSTTLHYNGLFMDNSIWNVAWSAAQVAADYADISPHVRGGDGYGQRLSTILWGWTKDGDNIIDNYYDATHSHFMVIGGVPGTTEAETEIIGTPGTAFSGLNLSNFPTRRYFHPTVFFANLSGTAVADSVGGSAYVTSITTSSSSFDASGGALSWTKSAYPELSETQFYLLARIKDASAAYIRIQPYVMSSGYVVNTSQDFSRIYPTATTYKLFKTNLGVTQKSYTGYNADTQVTSVWGYRSAGTANITTDYVDMFPRPYLYCYGYAMTKFTLIGNTLVKITDAPYAGLVDVLKAVGDIIEFAPQSYNLFQTLMGYDGENPALAYTLTYEIYCTPRYLIL